MADPTVDDLKAQKAAADTALHEAAVAHANKITALMEKHEVLGLLEGATALVDGCPLDMQQTHMRQGVLMLRNGLRLMQAATRATAV